MDLVSFRSVPRADEDALKVLTRDMDGTANRGSNSKVWHSLLVCPRSFLSVSLRCKVLA